MWDITSLSFEISIQLFFFLFLFRSYCCSVNLVCSVFVRWNESFFALFFFFVVFESSSTSSWMLASPIPSFLDTCSLYMSSLSLVHNHQLSGLVRFFNFFPFLFQEWSRAFLWDFCFLVWPRYSFDISSVIACLMVSASKILDYFSSSSSCCIPSTDFLDSLSPLVSNIHRSRQVFQTASCISTELLGTSWSSSLCSSVWRGPPEYTVYEFVLTSPAVSCMSGSSKLDGFRDRWLYSCCFLGWCLTSYKRMLRAVLNKSWRQWVFVISLFFERSGFFFIWQFYSFRYLSFYTFHY